ncbi:MAG: hypothetical protein K2Y08_06530 [Alphaproteobacteria bacterium]|nr:hypothetical protein [Alphaproteobacteria bacterium]
MMKQILPLLFCTACILQEAQAQSFMGVTTLEKQNLQEASFMGPTELKEITAKSLSVMGPLRFNHLKVEKAAEIFGPVANSEFGAFDSLIITGPFVAKNVTCSKLEATGPVDVTALQVSGATTIIGPLKAKKSAFQNLTITSDKVILEDSKTKDIVMKKNKDKKQVIDLKGKTIVEGNIIFESGKGVVEQGSDVKIQGEVKGATVEKK